jgi:aspartate racemase
MKRIGIVGGIAWRSTVDYYSELCRLSEQLDVDRDLIRIPSTPEICIESLDLAKAASYLGVVGDEGSWANFDEYHRSALNRLAAGGADFAIIASNTPHHRFEAITRGVAMRVIDLFEVVAQHCVRNGLRQVLILGTRLTMHSSRFQESFARYGVLAAGPIDSADQASVLAMIESLQKGNLEGVQDGLGRLARIAFARKFTGPPVVCLACTELPLAFPTTKGLEIFTVGGVTYVNPSAVHVAATLSLATGKY